MFSSKMRVTFREMAQKVVSERIGTGNWLNNSMPFDDGFYLLDEVSKMKAELILNSILINSIRKRDLHNKLTDINIFCANLLRYKDFKPISISLKRADNSSSSRYKRAGHFVTTIFSYMTNNGYINLKEGRYIRNLYEDNSKLKSEYTRMWPSTKFINHFGNDATIDYSPVELVILKNEKGNIIDYSDTDETRQIRFTLETANRVNRNYTFELRSDHINTDLYAIFNNSSFEQGGRLYNRYGYQEVSKNKRQFILIDSEPTTELDYSGLHPRLLYAMEGIEFPLDKDPYSCICPELSELRPFIKTLLLKILNSSSRRAAIASGNNELKNDYTLCQKLREKNIKTADLVERYNRHHPKIANYFFTQIGNTLMRTDSKIALDVIKHFTSRNLPILPIHDSFIVKEIHRNRLKRVMNETYQKHTGGFNCPIK